MLRCHSDCVAIGNEMLHFVHLVDKITLPTDLKESPLSRVGSLVRHLLNVLLKKCFPIQIYKLALLFAYLRSR